MRTMHIMINIDKPYTCHSCFISLGSVVIGTWLRRGERSYIREILAVSIQA